MTPREALCHYHNPAEIIEALESKGFAIAPADEIEKLHTEVERLNKWADSFSDAQLKERRLCEVRIQEMERTTEKLRTALREITTWNNRTSLSEPRLIAMRALGQ